MVEITTLVISVSTIDAILQAEDIEGLLSLGAPKDEYSSEAAQIQSALEALDEPDTTEDQVSALIMNVWEHSFGPFSDDDIRKRSAVLRRLVERIMKSK